MPLRAVLFDATGTLLELREPVGESYARMAAEHGVTVPAWRLQDAFRRVVARAGPRFFPDALPAERAERERDWWRTVVRDTFRAADQMQRFADFEAFFQALFAWYAGAEAWRCRPGADDALPRLRAAGLRLGIVSDFDHRLGSVLDALGIAAFFDVVIAGPGRPGQKPDPAPFRAALDALGARPDEAVYVGNDPERDLRGAAAAGLAAVDVRALASLAELPERLATLDPPPAPVPAGGRDPEPAPEDPEPR